MHRAIAVLSPCALFCCGHRRDLGMTQDGAGGAIRTRHAFKCAVCTPPPPGLQAKYYYSQDGVKWSDLQPVDEATAARCAKIKVRCAPHAWHANAKPASQLVPSHRLSKAALAHASSCQSHEHASGGGGAARAAAIAPRASSSACARTATSMCACKATAHAANRGRAWWSLKEGTTLALTRPTLSVGCRLP